MTVHIITIDGPSGSGKGTLAAKLAQHYGFHLLTQVLYIDCWGCHYIKKTYSMR